MNSEQTDFLIREYRELWSEYGIENPLGSDALLKLRLRQGAGTPLNSAHSPDTISNLEDARAWLGNCRRCPLAASRNQIVFGAGNPNAKIAFIGEAPGLEEDSEALPFVGPAGQLLTKIIEAMGFSRDSVYLTNLVKCRPSDNRAATLEEIAECAPFLRAQLNLVQPSVIVALGSAATSALTGVTQPMAQLRGRFHPLSWEPTIAVMPTYHPAHLLRNAGAKKDVWEDMKKVMARLGGVK